MSEIKRSRKDHVLGGVCGGLGRSMGIHPAWVRLLFVIGAFVVPPVSILGYLTLWIILPREEKGEKRRDDNPDSGQAGRVVSIVIAAVLILTGVLFLIPGAWTRIYDISAIFAALMLFAAAVKLGWDVFHDGEKSFVRISVASVAATIGVFLLLTTMQVLKTGVYVEYCKYILAAILIVCGIAMMTRETAYRFVGLIVTVVIYALIAVLSASRSSYDVLDVPKKLFSGFTMPNISMPKNVSVGGFNRVEPLPEGAKNADYRFNCAGGSLSVYPGTNLLDYDGSGFRPEERIDRVETAGTNGITNGSSWRVSFDNKLATATARFAKTLPATVGFTVSGGSLDADLRAGRVEKVTAEVSAGSLSFDAGTSLRFLDVKSSAGSVTIKLPRKSTVKLTVADNLSSVDVPSEFKSENGVYTYNGGGEVTLEAVVSLTTGTVSVRLE
jgi:phage shock protein PspC (stress-responsive transcriptional regulator)